MSELHEEIEDSDVILSGTEYRELLAANREQKAEIERLNKLVAYLNSEYAECSELVQNQELASLRASAGGEWIDVKQELPAESVRVLAFSPARPQWAQNERYFVTQMRHYSGKVSMFWFYGDINRWATHWQPLPAPPTLPTEEK